MDFILRSSDYRYLKNTVNFGDVNIYHLYNRDGIENPGKILRLLVLGKYESKKNGAELVREISYSVLNGTLTIESEQKLNELVLQGSLKKDATKNDSVRMK